MLMNLPSKNNLITRKTVVFKGIIIQFYHNRKYSHRIFNVILTKKQLLMVFLLKVFLTFILSEVLFDFDKLFNTTTFGF